MSTRVAVYIDGFNLYYGLRDKHGRKYLWLDLQALSAALLLPDQHLVAIHYFTARVSGESSLSRQTSYIDALTAQCALLSVHEGRLQQKSIRCRECGSVRLSYEEKETDVNVAVALVEDGFLDRYDTAIVVSADSDLCPAVRSVRRVAPDKRVVVAFPPRRVSDELRRAAHASFTIADLKIRRSLLPETVTTAAGVVLKRPGYWR